MPPTRSSRQSVRSSSKFYCPSVGCNSSFTRSNDLDRHMKTHTGVKSFICRIPGCGIALSQSSGRTAHEATHGEARRHECSVCGKRFKDASGKSRHQREVHAANNIICPMDGCARSYATMGHYAKHFKRYHPDVVSQSSSAASSAVVESKYGRARGKATPHIPPSTPSCSFPNAFDTPISSTNRFSSFYQEAKCSGSLIPTCDDAAPPPDTPFQPQSFLSSPSPAPAPLLFDLFPITLPVVPTQYYMGPLPLPLESFQGDMPLASQTLSPDYIDMWLSEEPFSIKPSSLADPYVMLDASQPSLILSATHMRMWLSNIPSEVLSTSPVSETELSAMMAISLTQFDSNGLPADSAPVQPLFPVHVSSTASNLP